MGETKFTPEFIQHQKDLYELARLSDEFAYPVVEWQENAANVLPSAIMEIEHLRAVNGELLKMLSGYLTMYDQGIIGALPNGNRACGVDEGEVVGGRALDALAEQTRAAIAKAKSQPAAAQKDQP